MIDRNHKRNHYLIMLTYYRLHEHRFRNIKFHLKLMTNDKHLGSDEAVKDLLLAMLTSNNTDGSVVVNANWDQVLDTMNSWGYNFTKSAMSEFLALIYNHMPTCNTLHISRPVVVVLRWEKKKESIYFPFHCPRARSRSPTVMPTLSTS